VISQRLQDDRATEELEVSNTTHIHLHIPDSFMEVAMRLLATMQGTLFPSEQTSTLEPRTHAAPSGDGRAQPVVATGSGTRFPAAFPVESPASEPPPAQTLTDAYDQLVSRRKKATSAKQVSTHHTAIRQFSAFFETKKNHRFSEPKAVATPGSSQSTNREVISGQFLSGACF